MWQLTRENIIEVLNKFRELYGLPSHVKNQKDLTLLTDRYHEQLAKIFLCEKDWDDAVDFAFRTAYKFPSIPHFIDKNFSPICPEQFKWEQEQLRIQEEFIKNAEQSITQ